MATQHQEIMQKLDRIDTKLNNHLERIAKVEERVEGQHGYIKAVLTVAVLVAGAIISAIVKIFWNK